MPKLRRLSGQELLGILKQFGFQIVRIRGSHHILRRSIQLPDGTERIETVNIPLHGSSPLATGTLKQIYRDLQRYVPDEELHNWFYS